MTIDINRVRQIVEAPYQISVLFEGDAIWIDNYDEATEAVMIHSLKTGDALSVKPDRLHEQ